MTKKVRLYSYLEPQFMTENEWHVALVTNAVIQKRDGSVDVQLERCTLVSQIPYFSRQAAIEAVPFYAKRLKVKPLGSR